MAKLINLINLFSTKQLDEIMTMSSYFLNPFTPVDLSLFWWSCTYLTIFDIFIRWSKTNFSVSAHHSFRSLVFIQGLGA